MTSNIDLRVSGMDCEKCERRITTAVSRLEGVRRVSADHVSGEVHVLADGEVMRDAVARQIIEAGYNVDE